MKRKMIDKFKDFITPPSVNLHINSKLKDLLNTSGNKAKVLELGSGKRRLNAEVVNMDMELFPNVDVIGDAHRIPFKKNSFDAIIADAVLEHVEDTPFVVDEILRVLRKGGLVYAEIPFLQPYHPAPKDFRRYTLEGIEHLFKQFEKIESGIAVGPTSALCGIIREYIPLLVNIPYIRGIIYLILGWMCLPLRYIDLLLVRRKRAYILASSLFFFGKK